MNFPEAATQTFAKGDPVNLTTGGLVEAAADTGSVLGLALEAASGTTSNSVSVLIINPWSDLFTASVSAAGATATSAQTDVGLHCSWVKSTQTGETAKTVIDRSDVTTPGLEMLGPYDPIGTVDGRMIFRWVPSIGATTNLSGAYILARDDAS
jgi:hypothetical protein